MTPDELREARVEEAVRRANTGLRLYGLDFPEEVARITHDLCVSDWRPTDPDLLIAREACARRMEKFGYQGSAAEYRRGNRDSNQDIQAALHALRLKREGWTG